MRFLRDALLNERARGGVEATGRGSSPLDCRRVSVHNVQFEKGDDGGERGGDSWLQ